MQNIDCLKENELIILARSLVIKAIRNPSTKLLADPDSASILINNLRQIDEKILASDRSPSEKMLSSSLSYFINVDSRITDSMQHIVSIARQAFKLGKASRNNMSNSERNVMDCLKEHKIENQSAVLDTYIVDGLIASSIVVEVNGVNHYVSEYSHNAAVKSFTQATLQA